MKRENLLTGFVFALSNANFPDIGLLWVKQGKKKAYKMMYTSFL